MRVEPKKSLGQNFLVDRNIARKIVEAIAPAPDEPILEIGPGEGALTGLLLEAGARVTAVEIDPEAAAAVRDRFGDRIRVIQNDILKVSLAEIGGAEGRIRVVGNIPYYITSPILFHLFDQREAVSEATLMMQREVAERLVALPRTKDYGILSVITQSLTTPERLFNVPPGCFHPRPKVTSSVVRLRFGDRVDLTGIDRLHRRLVREAFGKRRKTLNNALGGLIPDGSERAELFSRSGIEPGRRAEELTPEEFAHLARVLADAQAGKRRGAADRDDR